MKSEMMNSRREQVNTPPRRLASLYPYEPRLEKNSACEQQRCRTAYTCSLVISFVICFLGSFIVKHATVFAGLQIFFKTVGPKLPLEHKRVGIFLK